MICFTPSQPVWRPPRIADVYVHDTPEQRVTPYSDPAPLVFPVLRRMPAGGPTRAVALVLHGGRAHSLERTTARQLAYRRMLPLARTMHRGLSSSGVSVWLLRNRFRGWNEPHLDSVADARWALDEVRRHHPQAAVVVVGHSMGGRVALRVADGENVVGVCALAPWIEPEEPVDQLAGRTVLIVHGTRDRITDPARSLVYARRARRTADAVARFEAVGSGHAMVRRAADWHGAVRAFCAGLTGAAPVDPRIGSALTDPAPESLTRPLPAGAW